MPRAPEPVPRDPESARTSHGRSISFPRGILEGASTPPLVCQHPAGRLHASTPQARGVSGEFLERADDALSGGRPELFPDDSLLAQRGGVIESQFLGR
jgi:hypothetical protein